MSAFSSAVSLSASPLVAALVVASIALLPGDAGAQERRACRATGYFLFTLNEYAGGSVITKTARINILQSDMEVVATSAGQTSSTVTDAKRWACDAAASCYVRLAEGADSCGVSALNAVYETVKRPDHMENWRRQVACYHARAGSIPGLRQTSTNKVTLTQTRVVSSGSRDGITRGADTTIDESDHVCWSPAPAPAPVDPPAGDPTRDPNPPRPKPSRTDADHQPRRTDADHQPRRTDSSHQPSRTDDSHRPTRTNASPIESIKLTVTPREQKGKCPASVLMQARLELSRPVEVRWWVTGEGGYQSPKYVRTFNKPQASLIWRRHIDPKPALTQQGYFQLHFETVSDQDRGIPLGESEQAAFAVDCKAEPPNRFKR